MTKKSMVLALVAAGVLAGCSSPSVVQTKDGSQIVTPDKPEYDKKSGMYQYENNGKDVQINKDEVRSIQEVK
ncbi:YgdI/YgdR family lipoprotein [Bordetella genomosp. 9]|uniref:YgdI/YgdR family lipoprotein n=1 Tax=Bordetella genomosp. 9 TaxID=1416803 RepID=A0A1W6YYT2_9BORD|nr:YgdI/YgdR family lipoprotein [Bordetella genomosp. 9]ARP86151.1 YgdI/YgdR family lipoprotein [Bordetella genomosp. 9]